MATVLTVAITSGIPSSGTGTVSTIDNIINVWDKGAGTGGSATQRMLVDSSQLGSLGQAAKTASVPVVPATDWVYNTGYYVSVAASTQVAGGSVGSALTSTSTAGRIGDYLAGLLVLPSSTANTSVVVYDSSASAVATYAGGATTALLTLTPFFIPIGSISRTSGWYVATSSAVSVVATGRFS